VSDAAIGGLDGAHIELTSSAWGGFFEGSVSVENLREDGGSFRFDLLVPTSPFDIGDYIWKSEVEQGTTDKVVLTQDGVAVAGARMVAIAREGPGGNWDDSPTDRYRLTFDVPSESLHAGSSLVVHLRWSSDGQWVEHGRATSG
jgi:hypothetical protein